MSYQQAVNTDGQARLEARAEKISAESLAGCKNLRNVYGEAKEWLLDIGPYRFFLIPFLREWWVYDAAHKEWRFTGRRIGEARFESDGTRLYIRDVGAAPVTESAKTTVGPVLRFCPSCGTPAGAAWKFCQSCGEQLPPPQSV